MNSMLPPIYMNYSGQAQAPYYDCMCTSFNKTNLNNVDLSAEPFAPRNSFASPEKVYFAPKESAL